MTYLERFYIFIKYLGCLCAVFALSCSKDSGSFYLGSLDVQNPKIVITSQQAGSTALVMYDLNGNFQRILHDYNAEGNTPRGLVPLSATEFLISVDGNDHVDSYSITQGLTSFVENTNLNGNIFSAAKHDDHGLFVVETNTIESFDIFTGERIGNPRIAATVGSCTLNVPRGMVFNSAGLMFVVNTGNDDINVYDVTEPNNPLCVRANTTMANIDPVAILAHSNGFLYVGTQGDDRIYRFAGDGSGAGTVIFNNNTVILDPTAMVEMPDGSILVASDGTGSMVNIRTDGTLVGSTDFIRDTFTNSVSSIMILQESTQ
jgi:6-phosphogluconolactonase (cycloisomerase 2 family)